jgi:stress response protein YsnF
MPQIDTVLAWRGKTVRDRHGEKIGTLGALYLDAETDRPAYAGVHTGLFRRHESIVPLDGAEEIDGDVRVPHAAATVREAPNVDPDVALDDDEQARLEEHYAGRPAAVAAGRGDAVRDDAARDDDTVRDDAVRDDAARGDTPRDGSVRDDDGVAVVRSEEEVRVRSGPMRPRERVKLKKYVVTDYVEKTVPVQREEVRVEHDPPAQGGRAVDDDG